MDLVKDLTKRQREIFDYISRYLGRHGYPPTVREIGKAVGLHSSSTVHAHLSKLESLGVLKRDPIQAARARGDGRAGQEGRSPVRAAAGRAGRGRRADPGGGEHRGLSRGSRRRRRGGRRLHPSGARRQHEGRRHPGGGLRRRASRRSARETARSWWPWSATRRPSSASSARRTTSGSSRRTRA